ncbi:phosphoribosylanthranilate isomerase [Kordiimonas marina]|uniref:phosphoribosylanthranilate isomerase n=1 Tax=Kordiimonas marina TaxID=2872312 RepID=UPI001FF4254C|nr:phosphoribosylanthranilate isomerase [Kordiimonas marina]MCJ9428323.1 phosphoribosylanthranilate isomerase [Kordiimonas marina]
MSVRVKVCGIRDAVHANLAAFYGARWLGFVFFDRSPRHLTLGEARALRPHLPRSTERVGVFVNEDHDMIEAAVDALDLDWVQLHGDETPEDVIALKDDFGVSVIKAFGVRDAADIKAAKAFAPYVDAFLFDAKPPEGATLPGGNAVSFPWELMQGQTLGRPWLLAGGLTAENLPEAVKASGAIAVDVSSGVESAPGQKSSDKIEAFLRAAKAVR